MGKQDIDNYDKSLAEEFASKMFQFLNGGMLSLMISIGYKTGLFDILSELEPSTSQEIAQETKLDERYVREWLGTMWGKEMAIKKLNEVGFKDIEVKSIGDILNYYYLSRKS